MQPGLPLRAPSPAKHSPSASPAEDAARARSVAAAICSVLIESLRITALCGTGSDCPCCSLPSGSWAHSWASHSPPQRRSGSALRQSSRSVGCSSKSPEPYPTHSISSSYSSTPVQRHGRRSSNSVGGGHDQHNQASRRPPCNSNEAIHLATRSVRCVANSAPRSHHSPNSSPHLSGTDCRLRRPFSNCRTKLGHSAGGATKPPHGRCPSSCRSRS